MFGSFGMLFCGEALQGTLRCVECMAVEARSVGPGGARPVSGQVRQLRSGSVWLVDVCSVEAVAEWHRLVAWGTCQFRYGQL